MFEPKIKRNLCKVLLKNISKSKANKQNKINLTFKVSFSVYYYAKAIYIS